jgi:RNA polymerase sigma-70 factor (ECF subfamily)
VASLTSEPPSTSVSLIERVRGREPAAWNRLSAIYGPLVYRWCRRAGLQEADAADVLQEVFRALLTGIADFRPGAASGGFRGWLYGIARHKLADHFRRKARDAAGGEMAGHEPLAPLPDSSTDESADDAALVLHAALEQIRPDFDEHNWQAFYRTTIERQAAVDVAAQLGLTPGAVRQGKFRILRRLRQELDGLH